MRLLQSKIELNEPPEGEDELRHPLGFASRYGQIRFGLFPGDPPLSWWSTPGAEDEYPWNALIPTPTRPRDNGSSSPSPLQRL